MPIDLTEVTIQDIYSALVDDAARNEMIANDVVRAIETGDGARSFSPAAPSTCNISRRDWRGRLSISSSSKVVWGRSSAAQRQAPWQQYPIPNRG